MLAACGMLWWIQLPGQTQDAPQTAQGVPASLDGERGGVTYVGTQPLPVVEVVRSVPNIGVIVETPRIVLSSLNIVETRSWAVPKLSDAHLMAYFVGTPGGFVTLDHGREFVLFDHSPRSREVRRGN